MSVQRPLQEGTERCQAPPQDLPGHWGQKLLLRFWGWRGSLLFAVDLLIFFSSIILAYHLRYHIDLILRLIPPQNPHLPPITPFLKTATLLTISWLFLLARSGAYRGAPQLVIANGRQIHDLVSSGFYAFGLLMVFGVLYHGLLVSRVVYLLAFILAIITGIGVRLVLKKLENYLAASGILKERLAVIGTGLRTAEFLQHLKTHNPTIVVVGRLEAEGPAEPDKSATELPILGGLREIAAIFRHCPFDSLLFIPDGVGGAPGIPDRELIILAVNFCESQHLPFYMVPDALGVAVTSREVDVCRDYPVIELRDASWHFGYKMVKRLLDIAVSLVVLVLGLPFWVLIAVLIRRTSPGPIIYIQERVGLEGKPFKMYKFRSMVENADARLKEMIDFDTLPEPVFKLKEDPRVTPIGKVLRNWGLDEVPQFLNVLWGTMSLVGPRPEQVELVANYNLWQRRRLKAKPGITGYQQIMSRGDPSLEKRIALDLYYLKHQGLWLDLYILAKTIFVVLRGDGLK